MRIVAGKFKGRRLLDSTNLKELRPTTDKNREALFNILENGKFIDEINFSLKNAKILDICCGTGAVAFEALSRGATLAVLVDKNPLHIDLAKKNAKIFALNEEVKFVIGDANNVAINESFDMIFVDPPYASDAAKIVENLVAKKMLHLNSLVIIESQTNEYSISALKLLDSRKYGKSYFSFFMTNRF